MIVRFNFNHSHHLQFSFYCITIMHWSRNTCSCNQIENLSFRYQNKIVCQL